MRKYFYFRDVADENDDDDILSSIAIPVDSIAGVVPVAITTLELYLNKGGSVVDTKVTLTVTRGKLQEVMHEIASHINGHTLKAPLTVMCDAAATTDPLNSECPTTRKLNSLAVDPIPTPSPSTASIEAPAPTLRVRSPGVVVPIPI